MRKNPRFVKTKFSKTKPASTQDKMADALNSLLKGEASTEAKPQKKVAQKAKKTAVKPPAPPPAKVMKKVEEIDIDEEFSEEEASEEDFLDGDDSFASSAFLFGEDDGGYIEDEDDAYDDLVDDEDDLDFSNLASKRAEFMGDLEKNPSTLFTPVNIGIGVTVLGLAGYFGYKHFKQDDGQSK